MTDPDAEGTGDASHLDLRAYDDDLREFVAEFLRYDTTGGNERPAQAWLRGRLDALGFETTTWEADPERLAGHPSFPDDPAAIDAADRPSVAGVLEFGDPDAGRTLVLNGHADVVPAAAEGWTAPPFEPTWGTDGDGRETLSARGAVDMKAAVGACVYAARAVADADPDVDGRLVVECVAGEEEGGIGAAAAALDSPYEFERDAAVVAEPTDGRVVVATEGCLMARVRLRGRSAHAARRWRGESVWPRFERVRARLEAVCDERAERVTHPLYERFDDPWPVTCGRAEVGTWASNVPDSLVSEWRFGVAPGESLADVEAEYRAALAAVAEASDDDWLRAHPPSFERFGVQFDSAEIDADDPVVETLAAVVDGRGGDPTPTGETYGADSRHYVAAGVPTVVYGPGRIEEAHFPDETLVWSELLDAGGVLAETAVRFLAA
jgi:acetylornithine deacetylase